MTRPRGTGSIRIRNGWYTIKYYVDGVPVREAAHTKNAGAAQALLNKRLGQIAAGHVPSPRRERVKFGELLDAYLVDQALNNRRDQKSVKRHVERLRAAFGVRRASGVRADDIRRYVLQRKADGMANASINRELAVISRAFSLGIEHEKIDRAPKIKMLKQPAPRSGFFEREKFQAVLRHLRFEYTKDIAIVGYWLGWRIGEILALEPRQVDVKRGCIVLEPGKTKGEEGRVVYPPPPAWAVIEKWHARRAADGRIASRVFHRGGKPIKHIRVHWNRACKDAGYPGMKFHDLRRTAVRNMVRSGITESVAMKITGHRTRSVFERYNIVSEDDVRSAAAKMTNGAHSETGRAYGRTDGKGQKNAMRDRALLALLAGGGLRRAEAASVTTASINGRVLKVTGKGNKERVVPLPEWAVRAIDEFVRARGFGGPILCPVSQRGEAMREPLSGGQATYIVARRLWRRAGLPPIGCHAFRRGFGTGLLRGGVDPFLVSKLLGHSNPTVTMSAYDVRGVDDFAAAVDRLADPELT